MSLRNPSVLDDDISIELENTNPARVRYGSNYR